MISKLGRYGVVLAMLTMAGGIVGTPAYGDDGGDPEMAFTGNWNYWWADTSYSFANIGTSANRTCFMSGLVGNITPGPQGLTAAGVRINASGSYEIYVDADVAALGTLARCFDTSAGRTAEVIWRTGQPAKRLGAVAGLRRCFLTSVGASYPYPNGPGFRLNSDYVRVWQDGVNWWLGGVQSGLAWAKARCLNVNADHGGWLWIAGDPGTRHDPLAYDPGGVTCLMTGVGGRFAEDDWADGAYVSYEAGIKRFFMNTTNGHSGWAHCVR